MSDKTRLERLRAVVERLRILGVDGALVAELEETFESPAVSKAAAPVGGVDDGALDQQLADFLGDDGPLKTITKYGERQIPISKVLAFARRLPHHSRDGVIGTVTEAEKAASDLYSAASCALSTLVGLGTAEGGRMQFIRGVLAKHEKFAPVTAQSHQQKNQG
jgi:hypothetical protein